MAKDLMMRRQDLIANPTPRVPICLVLDCSPSMSGEVSMGSVVQQTAPRPIDELNEGIKVFFSTIQEDEVARYAAEISIVAFSELAEEVLDFDSVARVSPPKVELETQHGGTSIGNGVALALSLLDRRKTEYRDAGIDYFQPWLVLMTDGQPTDDTHIDVARKVVDLVNNKRLTVFPIGIGEGADMNVLAMFSPKRPPLRLKGMRFKEFFEWLSKSVSTTSQSIPGNNIPLDIEGLKGWSEL
jgi:uncharacterized protein YegL